MQASRGSVARRMRAEPRRPCPPQRRGTRPAQRHGERAASSSRGRRRAAGPRPLVRLCSSSAASFGKSDAVCPSRADPEQREIERDALQFALVPIRRLLRRQLPRIRCSTAGLALEPRRGALPHEPVVRALVARIGTQRSSANQSSVAAPVRLQPRRRVVGRAGRRCRPRARCGHRAPRPRRAARPRRGWRRRRSRRLELELQLTARRPRARGRGPSRPGSRSGTPRGLPPARARGSRGSSSRPET